MAEQAGGTVIYDPGYELTDQQFVFVYDPNGTFYVPLEDMPDYPYEPSIIYEKIIHKSYYGKIWSYYKFMKRRWNLHFTDVRGTTKNEIQKIVNYTVDGERGTVRFYPDINNQPNLYFDCIILNQNWNARETFPNLWSFDMEFEEIPHCESFQTFGYGYGGYGQGGYGV